MELGDLVGPIDLMADELTTLAFRRAERSNDPQMSVTLSGSLRERVVEARKGRIFQRFPKPIYRLEELLAEKGIQPRVLYSIKNRRTETIQVARVFLTIEDRADFLKLEGTLMNERIALTKRRRRVLHHTFPQPRFMGDDERLVVGDEYALKTSSDFFEDDLFPKESLHLDGSLKQLRQIDRFTRGNTHFIEHLSVTAREQLTFLAHKYNFKELEASCVEPFARNRSNSLSPSVLRMIRQRPPQDMQL